MGGIGTRRPQCRMQKSCDKHYIRIILIKKTDSIHIFAPVNDDNEDDDDEGLALQVAANHI